MNNQPTIPMPDTSNPKPEAGDRWFNYRSLQVVTIRSIDAGRALIVGDRSGKSNTVRAEDFDVPRWFKFLSKGEIPAEPAEAKARESTNALLLAEIRIMNSKLDRLLAVWEVVG